MSSQSIERIKSISKKEASGFVDSIPFGTDGLLVDMISGLDLEELIKLGSNHSATITLINKYTTQIIEQYYDNSSPKVLKYSVSFMIVEDIENNITTITTVLYKGSINLNNKLHTKITTIDESNSSITQVNLEVR